ncbi:MAG: hypothetical protein KGL39_00485 [Patescibacteria group bacterium]|nr:hypothetical protein [Patescibacteria group bacterium]
MARGYKTDSAAVAAAKRTGHFGLTGSGQQCLPVQLPDRSWAFWTAHSYFHPSHESGYLLLPGGELLDPGDDRDILTLSNGYFSLTEIGEWIIDELGIQTEDVLVAAGRDMFYD